MRKQAGRLDRIADARRNVGESAGYVRTVHRIVPASATTKRLIIRNVVDLPQPEGTEQHAKLARRHSERQRIDDRTAVIALGDVVEFDHPASRRLSEAGPVQHEIGGERHSIAGKGAEQHEIERVLAETLEHKGAEPAGADECRDNREPDRLHDHDAQPGEQYRQCQRQLDPRKDLPRRQPHPRAASITAGSMPEIPVVVLRTIGSSAYSTSAMIAGAGPMPPTPRAASRGSAAATDDNGAIKRPKSAIDGTVCNRFRIAKSGLAGAVCAPRRPRAESR